ncbi:hypothetical protein MKZ38_001015 [Zalerion maritima]|uniref:Uncharacterized protein n=1 Tax=Zalerion maritima TaxID=339359 RepID=A0AAD5RS79_9PEZI|nr:hypothetical protein MKZ38_001015 [Zalerion maritima]
MLAIRYHPTNADYHRSFRNPEELSIPFTLQPGQRRGGGRAIFYPPDKRANTPEKLLEKQVEIDLETWRIFRLAKQGCLRHEKLVHQAERKKAATSEDDSEEAAEAKNEDTTVAAPGAAYGGLDLFAWNGYFRTKAELWDVENICCGNGSLELEQNAS